MRRLVLTMLLSMASACSSASRLQPIEPQPSPLAVYAGEYRFEGGQLTVSATAAGLRVDGNGLNLLTYADDCDFEMIRELDRRTSELVQALISQSWADVADLLKVEAPAEEWINRFRRDFDGLLFPASVVEGFTVLGTVVRDESADHGWSFDGWMWETFCEVRTASGRRMVRFVWDPRSGAIDESGTGKEFPVRQRMDFEGIVKGRTHLLDTNDSRLVQAKKLTLEPRASGFIPTRFAGFDPTTRRTVSIRFRPTAANGMRLELGVLGSCGLLVAQRNDGS